MQDALSSFSGRKKLALGPSDPLHSGHMQTVQPPVQQFCDDFYLSD